MPDAWLSVSALRRSSYGLAIERPASAALGGYLVVAFLEATRFPGAALFLVLRLRPQGLLPERILSSRRPA